MTRWLAKLEEIEARYEALTARLGETAALQDPSAYQKVAKAHADLRPLVDRYRAYRKLMREAADARGILKETIDPEMRALAEGELQELEQRAAVLEEELQRLLLPKDPNDERNTILEIRAGAGGEEASLFAADLCRMYVRYAERHRWKVEVLSSHETGTGGFREVILGIEGKGAYSRLKFEGGVHRVQRVPETEAAGRIHTSTVTVAVLPEAEEVEVQIDPKDLRIDVYRSTGPGGQSVNTTDSAVRVTHLPTGLVVTCQDEKSQHKNKAKALKVLRARLLEQAQAEQRARIDQDRGTQVGTGERAEKIRTYNFPQNRITDHRIGLTLHSLPAILDGEIEPLIEALASHFQAERLKAVS
ncbi:MAG TPA: peptide chain release factor 1 [Candidatus Methylomirabilis sp.]|jgi:peptide chain release factor 1|nr:peptide chain release factor 1 [Candidatus Methylomirabilis sp.]